MIRRWIDRWIVRHVRKRAAHQVESCEALLTREEGRHVLDWKHPGIYILDRSRLRGIHDEVYMAGYYGGLEDSWRWRHAAAIWNWIT